MAIGSLLQSLFVRITADTSGVRNDLSGLTQQLSSLGPAVGKSMMGVGAALTAGLTTPLVVFGVKATQAASDVQELNSAFGFTFGSMAESVKEWARTTGDAIGRSTQDMQQYSMTAMQLFSQAAPTGEIAANLSKQFAQLAVDLGSFYNVADSDAMNALRSGLTGEAEPLRRFGIFLNEAAVKAKALEMGLGGVGRELTDQEKIMARAQIILEATTAAQGDAARTAGSLANQQRAARAAMDEAMVSIGEAFLPIMTQLASTVADVFNSFNGLDAGTRNLIIGVGLAAAALGPLLVGFGALLTTLGTLAPMFAAGGVFAAGGSLAGMGAMLGPIGLAVAGVVAAFVLFKDDVIPVLAKLRAQMEETLGPTIQKLVETFKELMEGSFGATLKAVMGLLGDLIAMAIDIFGTRFIALLNGFVEVVTRSFAAISDVFNFFAALLRGDFSAAWQHFKDFVGNMLMGVLGAVEAVIPGITGAMQRLVEGVRRWLVDGLRAVFDWVMEKIGALERAFEWLWDRVVGHSWIPDLVEDIGFWMSKLEGNMVDPALQATAEVESAFEGMLNKIGNVIGQIRNGDWGGLLGGLGDLMGGKWGGIIKGVGSIFDAFKGNSRSNAYSTPAYANAGPIAQSPVNTSPWQQTTVHVHANDAVLAGWVRAEVQRAVVTAQQSGPAAVAASTEIVPAEMGRNNMKRFF